MVGEAAKGNVDHSLASASFADELRDLRLAAEFGPAEVMLRPVYDEKRPPKFLGHRAARKFSSSATAEATIGALRA